MCRQQGASAYKLEEDIGSDVVSNCKGHDKLFWLKECHLIDDGGLYHGAQCNKSRNND